MKNVFFGIAFMLLGYSALGQNTENILNKYLAVKNALVSGNSKLASQETLSLQKSIKDDNNFAQKNALLKATQTMAKAGNLEKQRAAFNDVSTNMWKLVASTKKGSAPVYYQYCPMKQAYWLSTEKEIKNPYYGAAMLSCGSISDTK